MTTVISVRGRIPDELRADPSFRYVGRQCAGWPRSIWGNPFRGGMSGVEAGEVFDRLPIGRQTRDRLIRIEQFERITVEQAVACYEQWVECQPHLLERLAELEGKVLGCWCVTWSGVGEPKKPCHAVALARMVNPPERSLFDTPEAAPSPPLAPLPGQRSTEAAL